RHARRFFRPQDQHAHLDPHGASVVAHRPERETSGRTAGMSEAQMVDPHDVVMTGENSFIRLSNDEGKMMTDRVSHWRVLWSPSGQGHAMFVESPLVEGGRAIYADNFSVVRYLQRH